MNAFTKHKIARVLVFIIWMVVALDVILIAKSIMDYYYS